MIEVKHVYNYVEKLLNDSTIKDYIYLKNPYLLKFKRRTMQYIAYKLLFALITYLRGGVLILGPNNKQIYNSYIQTVKKEIAMHQDAYAVVAFILLLNHKNFVNLIPEYQKQLEENSREILRKFVDNLTKHKDRIFERHFVNNDNIFYTVEFSENVVLHLTDKGKRYVEALFEHENFDKEVKKSLDILEYSSELYINKEPKSNDIRVIKYLRNILLDANEEDSWFFIIRLDYNKLVNYVKEVAEDIDDEVVERFRGPSSSNNEKINKIIREYLNEYFVSKNAFIKSYSFAINLILRWIYNRLRDRYPRKFNIDYSEFLDYINMLPPNNFFVNVLNEFLENPSFVFILPKELFNFLKEGNNENTVDTRIFVAQQEDVVLPLFNLYYCKSCKRYFLSKPDTSQNKSSKKKKSSKSSKNKEIKCPFCESPNYKSFNNKYKLEYKLVIYSLADNSTSHSSIFVPRAIAKLIDRYLDGTMIPFIKLPYPIREIKGSTPVEKLYYVLVGLFDMVDIESEESLKQALESAIVKLQRVEDPLERLKILAKSVNYNLSTKYKYADTYITSLLIALATINNQKIIFSEDKSLFDTKPTSNVMIIGEPSAGKSSISERLSELFPELIVKSSLYGYTARQLSGYAGGVRPRQSVLLTLKNKMLVLDEAMYAREKDVYGILRDPLETGKLQNGGKTNTTFVFLMNDVLNTEHGVVRNLTDDSRKLYKLCSNILNNEGFFTNYVVGYYSVKQIGIVSTLLTRAFVERQRQIIIARAYGKCVKNSSEADKKYMDELQDLHNRGLLLSKSELRALFLHRIYKISKIYVTEKAKKLAKRYGELFAKLFAKLDEELNNNYEEAYVVSSQICLDSNRISNALIVIATGIAKLTRPYDVVKEDFDYSIIVTDKDVELSKYFYVAFSPDFLQEVAMKQLDILLEKLDEDEDNAPFPSEILANVEIKSSYNFSKVKEALPVTRIQFNTLAKLMLESLELGSFDVVKSFITKLTIKYPSLTRAQVERLVDLFVCVLQDLKNKDIISCTDAGVAKEGYKKIDVFSVSVTGGKLLTFIKESLKDAIDITPIDDVIKIEGAPGPPM